MRPSPGRSIYYYEGVDYKDTVAEAKIADKLDPLDQGMLNV